MKIIEELSKKIKLTETEKEMFERSVGRGLAPFIVFIRDVVLDVQL